MADRKPSLQNNFSDQTETFDFSDETDNENDSELSDTEDNSITRSYLLVDPVLNDSDENDYPKLHSKLTVDPLITRDDKDIDLNDSLLEEELVSILAELKAHDAEEAELNELLNEMAWDKYDWENQPTPAEPKQISDEGNELTDEKAQRQCDYMQKEKIRLSQIKQTLFNQPNEKHANAKAKHEDQPRPPRSKGF